MGSSLSFLLNEAAQARIIQPRRVSRSIATPEANGDPEDAHVPHVSQYPDTGLSRPKPTVPEPDFVTLAGFLFKEAATPLMAAVCSRTATVGTATPWLLRLG